MVCCSEKKGESGIKDPQTFNVAHWVNGNGESWINAIVCGA